MSTSFAQALQCQLANYKRRALQVIEDGIWVSNGRSYPHILPAALADLNLCGPLRDDMLALIGQHPSWKRHRDFHHLNSSQAMCWNLLMPSRVVPGGLQALTAALDLPSPLESMDFESVPDEQELTNFDCLLGLQGGGRVYLEAKLTEREFGAAAPNDKREQKRTGIYIPRLQGKVPDEMLEADVFFDHYQLLRNLSYLNTPADRLVLLLPRASDTLVTQALRFRGAVLRPWQSQVLIVFVEDLIAVLARQKDDRARRHLEECELKYVLR